MNSFALSAALQRQGPLEPTMSNYLFWFTVVGSTVAVAFDSANAQNIGTPEAGLALARSNCAECHAVAPKELGSSDATAPSFHRIANVPGMTETALYVALQTSHRTMPNIRLEPDEMRNVVAYILSLKRQD
jgi:mono/diheme cytochrome c family protein